MIIGCLSGSGRGTAVSGTYRFCVPGGSNPLAPDLVAEREEGAGPFGFAEGTLTDGDDSTEVGWRSGSVGEVGVDIIVNLGARHFVDRILLHQCLGSQPRGPL